jgi:hypothetical protein
MCRAATVATARLMFIGPMLATLLLAPLPAQSQTASLQLVSVKNIQANFLGPQAVWADREQIYLASYQGDLFVLARDQETDFPMVEAIQVSNVPLVAVRGDGQFIYVAAADGLLTVYRKTQGHLELNQVVSVAEYELGSLALEHGVLVAKGQGMISANRRYTFLAQANPIDVGVELGKGGVVSRVFGATFDALNTVVFDRHTGEKSGEIPNPRNYFGNISRPALYADEDILIQTVPGCCGVGIDVYSATDFSLMNRISRLGANAAMPVPRTTLLVAGNEGGQVDVFDLAQNPYPLVASADLRQITGHTGIEDIEIRAAWVDSSWGNDQSRGPNLPSFFVLVLQSSK